MEEREVDAKVKITRTELVWPGKCNEDGTLRKAATTKCFHWPLHGLLINDLERAVLPHYPTIARLKEDLLYLGAGGAAMSGSGSAVFGVFQAEEEAQRAARAFTGQRGVFVVKTLGTL